MIRNLIGPVVLVAVTAPTASAVSFDFAEIGNAGNAPDPDTGFGAVPYNYAISTTEVTNAQYTVFLNAVDPTGANVLALYDAGMASNFGGIELQAGNAEGSRFIAQAGREQNPVTFISFFDAMRFTNWLHNGQGSGDTETGAYTISDGFSEVRSPDARFWIPSEDEWYKAAYHDASAGTAGVYFDFATGSDSEPVSDQPGDNPAAVNYFNDDGVANGFNDGFAVSGLTTVPQTINPLTDVGAFAAATSPYGTFDQNGNALEWNEAVGPSSRGVRGGGWTAYTDSLRSDDDTRFLSQSPRDIVGFRVATVIPEPNTLFMGVACAAAWLLTPVDRLRTRR